MATYENQAEADFMAKMYTSRSGAVENTTFVILDPDGKTKLTRAGRGPFVVYRNGRSMAQGLNTIAKKYKSEPVGTNETLPYAETVRLGINLAASDNQPLLIVFADNPKSQKAIEEKLKPLVWNEPAIGKFVFATAQDSESLKAIEGLDAEPNSILFVAPDSFGQAGSAIGQLSELASSKIIEAKLMDVAANFQRIKKDHRSHVQKGIDAGVVWTPKIPVTDAQAEAARIRKRGESNDKPSDSKGRRTSSRDSKPGGAKGSDSGSSESRGRRPERDGSRSDRDRSKQFVEQAMKFDADGDKKLDAAELAEFAKEVSSRGRDQRGGRSSEGGSESRRRRPPSGERGGRSEGGPPGRG